MKTTIYFLVTVALIIFLYNGCSDDPVVDGGGGNNNTPDTAILYTDAFGNILGGDTTDWCLNDTNGFMFGPAWPNPTGGNSVHVKFYVPSPDTIKIYFLNGPGDSTVFYRDEVTFGTFIITISDTNNAWLNKVKRVYIQSKVNSSSQYCRFYGDIKFTQ